MRSDLRSFYMMYFFGWANPPFRLAVFAQWPLHSDVTTKSRPSAVIPFCRCFVPIAIASFTKVLNNCAAPTESFAHPSQPASEVVDVAVKIISDESSLLTVTLTFAGV